MTENTENTSFFREVDDEVRRERMEEVWRKYGRYVIGAVIAIVVGTAATTYWREQTNQKLEAGTTALASQLQSLKADNEAETIKALEALGTSAPGGQAALARLYAAGLAGGKDRPAALAELKAVAESASSPPLYRELAKLLSIQLRLDSDDAAVLQTELTPLMAKDQPWRWSAKEYAALLALKQGDAAKARALYTELNTDGDTPQGIHQRAARFVATPTP